MVWHTLQIGKHLAKMTTLTIKLPTLKNVTENGEEVKKRQLVKAEYEFVLASDTSKKIDKIDIYKSFNGKVFRKLIKTTETEYEKVKKEVAFDLNTEKSYFLVCKTLKSELKKDTAIKFMFSNGNGFKVYQAVVYKDDKDNLIMNLGIGFKSDMISKIDVSDKTAKKDETETVDRATLTDMTAMMEV